MRRAVEKTYFDYQANGRPFDALLVDLTVPGGMGGREVVKQIRERDASVRAIFSSGYSTDEIMANYEEHGFCARVSKPYRAADLTKVLRDVLESRAAS